VQGSLVRKSSLGPHSTTARAHRGCEPASPFFAKRIQSEFCGIGKSAQEPAGPRAPLNGGRWAYEKGAGRAAPGREQKPLRERLAGSAAAGRLAGTAPPRLGGSGATLVAASRRAHFLRNAYKMSFAGLGNPPKSPPARAPR
jgi:hypothetical protein